MYLENSEICFDISWIILYKLKLLCIKMGISAFYMAVESNETKNRIINEDRQLQGVSLFE